MQAYAAFFATGAIFSALFLDSGVQPGIRRGGWVCLAIFGALFVVTEIVALLV